MRKKLYKFLSIILAIIFASSLQLNTEKTVVHAATTTSNTPIVMYTRSTGRSNTYKSVNGAYSGYIDGASDKCSILALYDNGWCQVTYPTAKGNKTAYTLTSNFSLIQTLIPQQSLLVKTKSSIVAAIYPKSWALFMAQIISPLSERIRAILKFYTL